MTNLFYIIAGLLMLAVSLAFVVWLMARALKKSDDPPKLIFK